MSSLLNQSNLALSFGAVVLILGLATLGYLTLYWRHPTENIIKIGLQIRFDWAVTLVFLISVIYSPTIMLLYLAFISFLALKEFLSITPTRRSDRRVLFWAYLAITLQYLIIWQGWYEVFIVFIPIYVFFFLPTIMVLVGDTKGFLKANSTLNWGMMTTVFGLGHLAFLLMLPSEVNLGAGGAGLFLFLLIISQLSDVAQFLFGRLFDFPVLELKVSTTRNWASLIGSMASSALIAWLTAPLLTPLTPLEAVLIGSIVAVGSFIGYITMSAIKNDLQLKDRGTMVPGRGGVINRIDSLMFSAPLFFHVVYYLHY